MDSKKQEFLTTLVEYPEETTLTEYKSALPFDPRSEFGAKLIKHILGMANTGGGYIVIGFREETNGKLASDANLTDLLSGSYETTRLCQSVDSFLAAGQRIQLQVHKIQHAGKSYPVISVDGITDSPFFCGKDWLDSNSKPILRENAIYVRDSAAKTVLVAAPEHWDLILKRAVRHRQTELLDQLRSLLGELGLSFPSSTSVAVKQEDLIWFSSEAETARSTLRKLVTNGGTFEVQHSPVGVSIEWTQAELVAAAEKSVVRKTGWPIGVFLHKPEFYPKPTLFGARAIIETRDFGFFDYWSIHKNGSYYFLRLLDEDSDRDLRRRGENRWIYFDTRIWRVAEALLHCSNLYRELGLPPETQIAVRILHSGLKDRLLGVASPMRMMHWNRKCEENEVTWSQTVPLGSIEANLHNLTTDVTKQLFVLFEFWEPAENIFNEIFAEFLKSKV